MNPNFSLGDVVVTPAALEALQESDEEASFFLNQHALGNWGVVSSDDAALNDQALRDETRIFSAYLLQSGVRIWIISEADRSATTVFLPDQY
jgi:hypothetical protein